MLATAALLERPAAVLSHQSALRIFGKEALDTRVHLTVPVDGPTRAPGAVLHRSVLDAVDVTRRRGFKVTTLERTLVDLGATMGLDELIDCMEDHFVRRATTFARVETTFGRVARRGRTGSARTRTALARIDGVPPSESELERRFRRLLAARELPMPTTQVRFDWSDRESGRVDCYYSAANLIVELDGRRFHARLDAFERDRRRDQAALVAGLRTVRFTHRQIVDTPDEVARVLTALLTTDRTYPSPPNPCRK